MDKKLLPNKVIRVNVPRTLILRCYAKQTLTLKESARIGQKSAQMEVALNQLKNALSVVDKVVTKHGIKITKGYFK